jgi:hypothetical protein
LGNLLNTYSGSSQKLSFISSISSCWSRYIQNNDITSVSS